MFEKSFPPEARARIPPTTDAGDSPELEVWVSDARFHELTQCAVGARVTITVNQAPRSGAVNGADATVCALRSKADSGVYAIDVDIDGFGVHTLYKHHARSRVNAKGWRRTVKTFPARLAYARTGHGSIGATMPGRVYLHVREAFEMGLLYVMLSRLPKRRDAEGRPLLRIIGRLRPRDFTPIPLAELWAR